MVHSTPNVNALSASDKIFVYYPRGVRSGGPEALHQLVDALRGLGRDACLVPTPETAGAGDVRAYRFYDAPIREMVHDVDSNLVIVPETQIHLLRRVTSAAKLIWWLSIDNSAYFAFARLASTEQWGSKRYLRSAARMLLRERSGGARRALSDVVHASLHAAQSSYAMSYLLANEGITSVMLSDYCVVKGLEETGYIPPVRRGKTVAYNPVKGQVLLSRIRQRRPDINWLPIQDMTRAEVIQTLSSSAIYLDLGHHPGKDRLPREAALAGSIIVAAQMGSAAFRDDMNIPSRFKFSVRPFDAESLSETLDDIFGDAGASDTQAEYREKILDEQDRFIAEVREIFVPGQSAHSQGFENGGEPRGSG